MSTNVSSKENTIVHYLSGIVPILIGVLSLIYSYSLGLGNVSNPGPGLWPFLASAVIIASSAIVTATPSEDYESFTTRNTLNGGLSIFAITAYILLIISIGFFISSFLFFISWLKFMNGETWVTSLAVAIVGTVGAYVLFVSLLGVTVPIGVLEYLGL